jgi:hypothetical protein
VTALQQLGEFVKQGQRKLRLLALSRGLTIVLFSALAMTVVFVLVADRYKFANSIVLPLRIVLFLGLGLAVVAVVCLPLRALTRRRVVALAEEHIPEFGQRLLTVVEKPDQQNPFTGLIAEEALEVAHKTGWQAIVPERSIYAFAGLAALTLGVLLWLITAGPGFWGYGASLLWTGTARASKEPLYAVHVQPGNRTVRRHANQVISAQLVGFSSRGVVLHARYRGTSKWDTLAMQPERAGNGYQLLFTGLGDTLDYYVDADGARSKQFTLSVKDLPAVKQIRVSVRFPSGLGLKNIVDDASGDIRAVVGSEAEVAILPDRPLNHGLLSMSGGKAVALTPSSGGWYRASFPVRDNGTYHIASVEDSETVRLSDDYFIDAKQDEPPTVRVSRPGNDPHVSPIEELAVAAEASDDFGVDNLQLHFSVNGNPEQVRSLGKGVRAKEVAGKTMLYLEDFKLAPGDLISLYATAKDASHTAKSDMIFAQADPFDYKFQQSQQAGGGGGGEGGGNQNSEISKRQKEVIAATWNQLKDGPKERSVLSENARFLSDMERQLKEQSKALAERLGNRDLTTVNPQFQRFAEAMTAASQDMAQAVDQLSPAKWLDALPPEQRALQSLLRAESIFRDIQVAQGRQGGNGMGDAGRDLARMFDLELDTSKNQYETNKSASAPSSDQQKQLDDAFQRLKDLARRQEEMAQQRQNQQSMEQRWEEEQLRREAEQLRQQLQQLAKNNQSKNEQSSDGNDSQSQSSSSSSGSSGRSSRSGRTQAGQPNASGSSSADTQGLQRSMEALNRAEKDMEKATTNGDKTAQGRAASELGEAQNAMKNMLSAAAGQGMSGLADKAQELASRQRDLANRIKGMYGAAGINTARNEGDGNGKDGKLEMPEMSGPGFAGRNWYRRRFSQQLPDRGSSPQEKSLAEESQKLASDVEQLQKQLQGESSNLRSDHPDAARKLRQALSDAEQEELALRIQKNGEWLRQGYGSQTWPMQDSVTAGLDRLNQQMRDAEQSVKNSPAGGGNDAKMAEALQQVRSLREQLERQSDRSSEGKSQNGSDSGSPSQGRGNNGRQQTASASPGSQGGQSGQNGQAQSGQESGSPGQPRNGYAPNGSPGTPAIGGRGSEDAVSQLQRLRNGVGRGDRELDRYLNDAIGSLRNQLGQSGLLEARVNNNAVVSLERLEVELLRRVGEPQATARVGAPESAPEKYRDAVAEYFKRLSK